MLINIYFCICVTTSERQISENSFTWPEYKYTLNFVSYFHSEYQYTHDINICINKSMRISIFLTFLTTKYFQSFGLQIKWQEEKYNFSLSLLWMRRIYFYKFKNPVFCGSIFLCFWTVLHTLLFVIFYLVDSLSYQSSLYNKTKSFFCYFVTNTFPVSPPLTYGIYHRVFLQIIFIQFSNLFFSGFYFCFCFRYLKHPSPKFVLFAWLPFLTFICLFEMCLSYERGFVS